MRVPLTTASSPLALTGLPQELRSALGADNGKLTLRVTKQELAALRDAVTCAVHANLGAHKLSTSLSLVSEDDSYLKKVEQRVHAFEALSLLLERAAR